MVVVADDRARDAIWSPFARISTRTRLVKSRAGAAPLLVHLDPALGRDQRRVHVVHRLVGAALEGAVQRGRGQQARVVAGERAVVGERDRLDAALGELHRQAAELRGERDERAEHLEVLGADRRDVDRVRDDRALERGGDLLGDDHASPVLRLLGRGGEVRGHDDVVELEQRPRVRLLRVDVERARRGELARSAAPRSAPPRPRARRGRR